MQTEAKRLWKLNEALSLGVLSPAAALYAPLAPPSGSRGLPHLHWQPDRAFHTSALCGAALDGITLPYRLHSPSPTSPLGMATGAPPTLLSFVMVVGFLLCSIWSEQDNTFQGLSVPCHMFADCLQFLTAT